MTEPTKDQAIAVLIEANDQARSLGFLNGTSNWAGVLVSALQAQSPAPDCRTCALFQGECIAWDSTPAMDTVCTNGDQYQPAPKVVLWRTEREIGLAELKANWSGDPPDGGFEKYVELHGQPIEIRDPKP